MIDKIYKQPILDAAYVSERLAIHPSSANRLIKDFQDLGILNELTGYKRNRMFGFSEYINLFSQS